MAVLSKGKMKSRDSCQGRPRNVGRVIALDCFIRTAFCLYMIIVSWHRSMDRPYVESSVKKLTLDGFIAGGSSIDKGETTIDVHERPSLKTHSEIAYTDMMSLLHDTQADGSINKSFYEGFYFSIWRYILPFISWDGERMLKVALDGLVYGSEDSAAFFPLLPWLSNIGGRTLKFVHLIIATKCGYDRELVEAPNAIYMGIAGLLVANLSGIAATALLYVLIWEILHRRKSLALNSSLVPALSVPTEYFSKEVEYIEKIAYLSAFFFCVGPSTVHRTSLYTENIFCFLTFSGMWFLLKAEEYRKPSTGSGNNSCIRSMKRYLCELAAVLLFFIGSLCRSNGILMLIPLFFYTLRTCGLFSELNMFHTYGVTRHVPESHVNRIKISFISLIRFIGHWLRALCYAVIIFLPMVTFQFYMYCIYCLSLTPETRKILSSFTGFIKCMITSGGWRTIIGALASKSPNARPWCYKMPPGVYNFVQKKYWDVGFMWILREPSRLHVFLYCGHLYLVTYSALHWYATYLKQIYCNIKASIDQSKHVTGLWSLRPLVTVISHPEFGIQLHMLVTALTFLFFAHTHVYMRQTLAIVPYSLYLAVILEPLIYEKNVSWRYMLENGRKLGMSLALLILNVGLCFVGGALFSNFLGYT